MLSLVAGKIKLKVPGCSRDLRAFPTNAPPLAQPSGWVGAIWKSRAVQAINRQKPWLALCRAVLVLCAAGSWQAALPGLGRTGQGLHLAKKVVSVSDEARGGAGQRAVCLAQKGERTPKDLKICPLEQRRFQAEKQVGVLIRTW